MMHPSTSTLSSSSLLFRYVAMTYCYSRMIKVLFYIPFIITLIGPIVFYVISTFIDTVSYNLGMICIVVSMIGTMIVYQMIYQITKSMKNSNQIYKNAIIANQIKIPITMLFVSCIICRKVITPILQYYSMVQYYQQQQSGYDNNNDNDSVIRTPSSSHLQYLSCSWWVPNHRFCIQCGLVMILLDVIILFRYVGPASIVRCSIVPLLTNPWRAKLLYLINYPWIILQPSHIHDTIIPGPLSSISTSTKGGSSSNNNNNNSFLQNHQQPLFSSFYPDLAPPNSSGATNNADGKEKDKNNETISSSFTGIHQELCGRRFQGPTLPSTVAQFIFPIWIGILITWVYYYYYYATAPEKTKLTTNNTTASTMMVSVCILATLAPTILSSGSPNKNSFGGHITMSQEINSFMYLYPLSNKTAWAEAIRGFTIQTVIASLLIPIIAIFIHYCVIPSMLFNNHEDDSDGHHVQTNESMDYSGGNVIVTFVFVLMRNQKLLLEMSVRCFFICSYLTAMDELLKIYVIHCLPDIPGSIKGLVDQIQYDTAYMPTLTVILQSLLFEQGIVKKVLNMEEVGDTKRFDKFDLLLSVGSGNNGIVRRSNNNVMIDPSQVELDSNDKLMQEMCKVLLSISPPVRSSSAGNPTSRKREVTSAVALDSNNFEEDVLRLIMLESIGGSGDGGGGGRISSYTDATTKLQYSSSIQQQQQPQQFIDHVSKRHQREIQLWIDGTKDQLSDDKKGIAITLVRGLAVFVGGFGEALSLCSSPVVVQHPSSVAGSTLPSLDTVYSWTLSPTSFLLCQFAVRGLSRIIVRSFKERSGGRYLPDWTNSSMATMVPTALTALFYLRVGVIHFSKYQAKNINVHHTNDNIVQYYENELYKIRQICDAAGIEILQAVHSLGRSSSNFKLELKEDILQWTRSLMSKGSAVATPTPKQLTN